MSSIKQETVTYAGWPDCLRLSNGSLELVVATVIGPRILHCSLPGRENIFCLKAEDQGKRGGAEWRNYGGHRLWHSPEAKPRSYSPDNDPVNVTAIPGGVRLTQAVEPWPQIEKEIEVTLHPASSRVTVTHRLTNRSAWPLEFAAWALSVMATGGLAVIPQAQGDPNALLPNRTVTLWPYARMNDPRVTWGERFVLLRQDPGATTPFKLGMPVPDGWAAYANQGQIFVKYFQPDPTAAYPDWGAMVESYTSGWMLELETLSPLRRVEPGETLTHVEEWLLLEGEVENEAEVEKFLLPRVKEAAQ